MTFKKNMLLVASIVTLSFSSLLVWLDNALAQYIETRSMPVLEAAAPKSKLSGHCIYPAPNQNRTLHLPEVCIRAPKGKAAGKKRIP